MYSFSLVWFFIGLAIEAAGLATLKYYDKISEFMGTGVGGYQKWKIAALVMCGGGLLMMFNLHTLILEFVANLIFGGALGK